MGAFLSRIDAWSASEKRNDGDAMIDNAEADDDGNLYNQPKSSVLSRHAGKIVAFAFLAYAIVAVVLTEFGCGGGGMMDVTALAVWMFGVLLSVSVALVLTLAGMLLALVGGLITRSHHGCLALICTAAVVLGVVSSVVALARPAYSGVCRDAFGVVTMSTTWTDLVVSSSLLLVTVVLADEDKVALTRVELISMLAALLWVPLLLVALALPSQTAEIALFVAAWAVMVPLGAVAAKLHREAKVIAANLDGASSSRRWLVKLQGAIMRARLATISAVVFSVLFVTYILTMVGVTSSSVKCCVFLFALTLMKALFAAEVVRTSPHAAVTNKLISEVERERALNANKRSVLQFVFHEVRVPLNTITLGISVVEGMIERVIDPVVTDALQMMTGASQFMSDTLNTVLSISKVEEGAMELSFAPFVLKDLVNKVGMVLKGQLDAKNITLAITSPDKTLDTVHYATGDGFRLEHVLANFLSNAIKFSPDNSTITIVVGTDKEKEKEEEKEEARLALVVDSAEDGPKVDATSPRFFAQAANASMRYFNSSLKRLAPGNAVQPAAPKRSGSVERPLPLPVHLDGCNPTEIRWIEIIVCDQGVGIPPEKQVMLFQVFSQIDAQALQQGQGSGLGLVFAQQIIELHGGKVVFRSEVGKGSVFGFSIPFRVLTAEQMMAEGDQRRFCDRGALTLKSSNRNPEAAVEGKNSISERHLINTPGISGSFMRAVGAASGAVMASVRLVRGTASSSVVQDSVSNTPTGEVHNRRGSAGMGRVVLSRIEEQQSTRSPRVGANVSAHPSASPSGKGVSSRRPAFPVGSRPMSRAVSEKVPGAQSSHKKVRGLSFRLAEAAVDGAVDMDEDGATPKRVLIVDDTPSNSRMLKLLLERSGFACDLAENGEIAVGLVKDNADERHLMEDPAEASRHAYKLIFMDHQMPVMDGLEATKLIRTACHFSSIIIGCSGNTDERDQAMFFAAGADYVLPKPVRLADLDKVIEYCRTVAFMSIPNTKLVMSVSVSAGLPVSRLRAMPLSRKVTP